jgi:glutaredoxin 3
MDIKTPAISIYSTPACHFCHMAKDMLSAHSIPFTDYNVATDLEKRQEMITKSGQMGVPVIVVTFPSNAQDADSAAGTPPASKEEVIIGFDEERLRTLLNIKD